MQRWYITKIPQRRGPKQAQPQYSQYKHICIEFIYEIIQLRLLQTVRCWCAKLMRRCRLIVSITGLGGELHLKQEARATFAAMSREHVTEEDIETFVHVRELAMQVRKLPFRDYTLTNQGLFFQVNQNVFCRLRHIYGFASYRFHYKKYSFPWQTKVKGSFCNSILNTKETLRKNTMAAIF